MPGSKLPLSAADGSDVTDLVRLVYDMAVNSMDYGSGFLSTEEYDALANLAEVIGASDLLDVRAEARRARYPQGAGRKVHAFRPDREGYGARCLTCGDPENHFSRVHPRPEGGTSAG